MSSWKSSTIYRSDLRQERNNCLMSVHTSGNLKMLSEKISASTGSGKEMAGLKKMKNITMMMTRKS